MRIIETNGRKIVIEGVGKLFYESGFPISMSIEHLTEKGHEVSVYHVVDELIKHGWSNKTILSKIKDDFGDMKSEIPIDIEKYISSSYDDQRQMIFDYLWGSVENVWHFLNQQKC